MIKRTRSRRAFTLVELVVTIGIIAAAAALVIPAVVTFRARMGDVGCQNNLRQLLTALQMYNNDNNGSMPYGFYYVNSHPVTWQPVGQNTDFISWASELNRYFGLTAGYAPAFRCPNAQQQAGPHLISYVMNFIVGVSPVYEYMITTSFPPAQRKPPSLHLMLQEGTALFWDTAISADLGNSVGYLTGADIDNQRFWTGADRPQVRYFLPHDPLAAIPPGILGNNRMVQLSVGTTWRNIDPPLVGGYPYQGNLRFRHDKQTKCNVAFSDGSVRQFTGVLRPDLTIQTHDALRRYFMIHWPPGVRPSPTFPSVTGPPLELPVPGRKKPAGPTVPRLPRDDAPH